MSEWAIQSNRPPSTTQPPRAAAWPSMYLVVEWVTMSAPQARGRQRMGVAKVLSTMRGTPRRWAAAANFSMSSTVRAGLAMVSPNTALVFGRKAASSSWGVQSGETKVNSTPIFFMVTAKRL